jgi:hypothetical protein
LVEQADWHSALWANTERTMRMAVGMYFAPGSFTPAQYDEANKRLEAAGVLAPKGRRYHVALESDGQIQVFDIWESEALFQEFGATLMPVLAELGIDPGQPQVSKVHNIMEG